LADEVEDENQPSGAGMANLNMLQEEEFPESSRELLKIGVIDLEKKDSESEEQQRHDNPHATAAKALSLSRKNTALLIGLLLVFIVQIYFTWHTFQQVSRAPDLDLEFSNGERLRMHLYKYELSLKNTGALQADGAHLSLRIPRDLLLSIDGHLAPPPARDQDYGTYELEINKKIWKGKQLILGPAIFRFDRLVPSQNLEYTLSAPAMEDKKGIFTIHDLDY